MATEPSRVNSRSLRVTPSWVEKVKRALPRNGFARQTDLAFELGLATDTVRKFLNGKPVNCDNFFEICRRLALEPQEITIELNGGLELTKEQNLAKSGEVKRQEAIFNLTQPPAEAEFLAAELYVERPPIEANCHEAILQPGALIRIKAPKQMGKTWLMDQILRDAAREGYKTVPLNLLRADHSVIAHLDKFLRWFCARVSRQLCLPNRLADAWDEDLGSNDNCMSYFEEYLLRELDTPLVLGLDNVDQVFPYHTVAQDFFGLLRACHEAGNRGEIWQNLRLVVAHSTEVYIPLNVNQSPFNVGLPIELPEFSPQQIQNLATKHGLDCNEVQLEKLREMIGGHPYLVQQAFTCMRDDPDTKLEEILKTAPTEAGLYQNHLREHLIALQQDAKLAVAMKKIVDALSPVRVEVEEAFKLESMGLVHKQGNEMMPSCLLYRLYFSDRLEVSQ
ncbi:MAG: DNA-binding protein [Symploca sp. SIO2E6]|nr:DNA-binding protein [Symploca sp. SIO2E6]